MCYRSWLSIKAQQADPTLESETKTVMHGLEVHSHSPEEIYTRYISVNIRHTEIIQIENVCVHLKCTCNTIQLHQELQKQAKDIRRRQQASQRLHSCFNIEMPIVFIPYFWASYRKCNLLNKALSCRLGARTLTLVFAPLYSNEV